MRRAILAIGSGAMLAASAFAATPGYTQDFNSGFGDWGGGSESYTLPTGGAGGAADQFLEIANTSGNGRQLGARVTQTATDLTGNLSADGVSGFSFWLKDTGGTDSLEIHFGVGAAFTNFWITTAGFTPTATWTQHSVDLTDASQWTQIIGSGTFADAVANTDRLLFRHDVPPLVQFPEFVEQGEFGVDEIHVLPEPTGLVLAVLAGAALFRRR